MNSARPLSELLRPGSLDEFLGQLHLVGPGKIIRSYLEQNVFGSVIFWGPPGTGKTTLSRIIVNHLHYPAREFSATVSSIAEIREIMKQAAQVKTEQGKSLVVFIDEIHHFNKHSQDAFLPYVERGDIILIGTTVENPAYKINRALLSRLKILEFYKLSENELKQLIQRGIARFDQGRFKELNLAEEVIFVLLNYCDGDARRLINLLETLFNLKANGSDITVELVKEVVLKNIAAYDRSGDERYQLISAFHKSVRNSDLDATLYWLYRLMEGGEDLLFIIRRMIRIAVEDIGFADPHALDVCLRMKSAYEYLGSPEGDLFLTQTAVYLTTAPKSNSLYVLEKNMKKLIASYPNLPVPLHIVNPSNFISKKKGAGAAYLYAHDFPEKTTLMETMPAGIAEKDFYCPNDLGFEKKIKERIAYWKQVKARLAKPG